MARPLNTPITDDGVAGVQFFNGRVLSAADLQDEQTANRLRRAQVGRALGTGIAHGFQVEAGAGAQPQTLRIRSGLAISPAGHPVALPVDATVSVVDPGPEVDEPGPETEGQFAACASLPSVRSTGAGAYLLVACPATEPRERTPRVDPIGDGGRAGSCGPKYAVEGVRFRLVYLDVGDDRLVPAPLREDLRTLMDGRTLDRAEQSRLRNLIAHWCLGTVERRSVPADLYDRMAGGEAFDPAPVRYGPVDHLRASDVPGVEPRLSDHDVPLAVFVWDDRRIQLVDVWAVRRRVHRTGGSPEAITDRQQAEGEAVLRQFQAQIDDLFGDFSASALAILKVHQYFDWLPPVGIVPEQANARRGFNHLAFFDEVTTREPVFMDGARLPALLDLAKTYPPMPLATEEFWWLYRIRQNRQQGEGPANRQAYLVFTSGFLPFAGDAQYNLARWSFGNYGVIGPTAPSASTGDAEDNSGGSDGSESTDPGGSGATIDPIFGGEIDFGEANFDVVADMVIKNPDILSQLDPEVRGDVLDRVVMKRIAEGGLFGNQSLDL